MTVTFPGIIQETVFTIPGVSKRKMELKKQFELTNKEGLHARPAMKLVETASRFLSEILIRHKGKEVNAKSIMSVLTLGASKGMMLEFVVKGEDADSAMAAIEVLISGKFDEG